MTDENDAYRAGFDAFNEDEVRYRNPYISYHKHNAFITGWNEARRAKGEQLKATHQLSTAPKAGASAGEATAPLRRVMPQFNYFVVMGESRRVVAGFSSAYDAHLFYRAERADWGGIASPPFDLKVTDNEGKEVDAYGEFV